MRADNLYAPQCTPSCLVAIVRYLVRCTRECEENLATFKALLMPSALRAGTERTSQRPDLDDTIEVFARLRLLDVDADRIALSAGLLSEYADRDCIERDLPIITLAYASGARGGASDPLLKGLAWFLTQPITDLPGTWVEFDKKQYPGAKLVHLTNDVPYLQLRHWGTYMGLVGTLSIAGRIHLFPDPTLHLSWRLPQLIGQLGTDWIPIRKFMSSAADLIPVLEGGTVRRSVTTEDRWVDGIISSATALALHQLADGQLLELDAKADAEGVQLDDGVRGTKVTHIRLNPKRETE